MLEFSEDIIIGEGQNCWGDSHENLYIFDDNGKGVFIPSTSDDKDSKEYKLAWKINKNGILILKTDFDKKTFFLKITKKDENYFECTKYIKNENETEIVETIKLAYINIEEEISSNDYSPMVLIKNHFEQYNKSEKIYIILAYLFISSSIYISLSFIPFLNSTALWLKLLFVVSIILFTYKKTYYLITKIVKNRNKNDSKHDS